MNGLLTKRIDLKLDHCYEELKHLVEKKEKQLKRQYGVERDMRVLKNQLPDALPEAIDFDRDCIKIGSEKDLDPKDREPLFTLLKAAHPWRKGPFELFGIHIDTEWRSYIKWNRLKDHISPLKGRRVLDIGSSSGYYMFRMTPQAPEMVLGIEPYIRFYYQYLILQKYIQARNLFCIPAKLEELPPFKNYFHTVFCMGILYHRKSPIETLEQIHKSIQKKGELILETLIIDGEEDYVLSPHDRYAKMRNVFFIPTVKGLSSWLSRTGFSHIRCIDISPTTEGEQRKTEWVNTESLSDFLDPEDPSKTVEGYPAPVRAIFIADVK
ncbi:MAG: tRNA 5-methoxyuridine(34)/uridine 5-oxyacetic acid(34) synthase CmoB [Proteobacteria bacterium]|nr:tRNA 5-methoxyuridine(34)/uridine 5-oxyacetic acid(34) synthase CmoB [Pseudomonadota bacterium]